MAFAQMRAFAFRFSLPDGDHIGRHTMHIRSDIKKDGVRKAVIDSINKGLGQNEDAHFDGNVLEESTHDHSVIDKMVAKLRAENPNRPLANDLGLDTNNRLLTNPEVARNIAAANQVQQEA